jgi:hypothetical protein
MPTPAPRGVDPTAAHDAAVRALAARIASGELDEDLPLLAAVINQRLGLLAAARSTAIVAGLAIGDRVRINHDAKPLYLHGCVGTVTGWHGPNVVVQLDHPVGRFTTGQLRCPPLVLDPMGS